MWFFLAVRYCGVLLVVSIKLWCSRSVGTFRNVREVAQSGGVVGKSCHRGQLVNPGDPLLYIESVGLQTTKFNLFVLAIFLAQQSYFLLLNSTDTSNLRFVDPTGVDSAMSPDLMVST